MPNVRSIFITVLLSWSTAALVGGELPDSLETPGTPEVEIEESIIAHSGPHEIQGLCRSSDEVMGCTDFPLEIVEASCVPTDGSWRIEARANLRAEIHIRIGDMKTFIHEKRHLEDLKSSLANHLETVLETEYPIERICRTKARILSSPSYLRDVMNRLRVESNRKFGCS